MILLILQNLGLRSGILDLSDIKVPKEARAMKGELGRPLVFGSGWELLLNCIDLEGTIGRW